MRMCCASPVWDFSACLCPGFYLLRCWFPWFFLVVVRVLKKELLVSKGWTSGVVSCLLKVHADLLLLKWRQQKNPNLDLCCLCCSLPRNTSFLSVPVTAKRINVKAELSLCLSLIQIPYYAANLAAVKLGCKYSSWRMHLHEFRNERISVNLRFCLNLAVEIIVMATYSQLLQLLQKMLKRQRWRNAVFHFS